MGCFDSVPRSGAGSGVFAIGCTRLPFVSIGLESNQAGTEAREKIKTPAGTFNTARVRHRPVPVCSRTKAKSRSGIPTTKLASQYNWRSPLLGHAHLCRVADRPQMTSQSKQVADLDEELASVVNQTTGIPHHTPCERVACAAPGKPRAQAGNQVLQIRVVTGINPGAWM